MKTLEYYLKLNYKMEIIPDVDEGGFVVSFPELPGCFSSGETVEKAIANANDAKKSWLQAAIEDEIDINLPNNLANYSGRFELILPRSLHRSLAEHSKKEGLSMNQYCLYLLTKGDAALTHNFSLI